MDVRSERTDMAKPLVSDELWEVVEPLLRVNKQSAPGTSAGANGRTVCAANRSPRVFEQA